MDNEPVKNKTAEVSSAKTEKAAADSVQPALSDSEVTAHTSSMWKYNPVPEAPEGFPEYRRSRRSDPDNIITVTAARVRGKMHKHDGSNCDDWYEYDFGGGMAFAAVSDGAGSKIYSRIGAKAACEAAVRSMKKSFTEFFGKNSDALKAAAKPYDTEEFGSLCSQLAGFIRNSAIDAVMAAEGEAHKRKTDKTLVKPSGEPPELSDFSATLLLAAVIPVVSEKSGEMECLLLSVQIGDGMIAAVNSKADLSSALSIMGSADSGEFSGETDFITSPKMKLPEEIMKRTKVTRRRCTEIFMMTDGVADDYFPNDPELLRLYTDLAANGIIPLPAEISPEDKRNKKIPSPQKNIWVNDNDVTFEFQYMSAVCEALGITTKELWDTPRITADASLKAFGREISPDPSEQLQNWLDNYLRRGSFDDRTLLIISIDDRNAGKGNGSI